MSVKQVISSFGEIISKTIKRIDLILINNWGICFTSLYKLGKNEVAIMKIIKIVVEKHPDTYVAYPLGLKGVVISQGDSYESALEDLKSAIKFHIETFGT